MFVLVYLCACVYASVCAFMHVSVCVHACVWVRICVHACGVVGKWLKCLTTEQKVPGSSSTMHVYVYNHV